MCEVLSVSLANHKGKKALVYYLHIYILHAVISHKPVLLGIIHVGKHRIDGCCYQRVLIVDCGRGARQAELKYHLGILRDRGDGGVR